MQRTKIPEPIEARILFLNRHTCCVCHEKNKDVQIHHIDGNNANHKLHNLAVLSKAWVQSKAWGQVLIYQL